MAKSMYTSSITFGRPYMSEVNTAPEYLKYLRFGALNMKYFQITLVYHQSC
jgi:hypothetical protein